jgi:hypothetical protein
MIANTSIEPYKNIEPCNSVDAINLFLGSAGAGPLQLVAIVKSNPTRIIIHNMVSVPENTTPPVAMINAFCEVAENTVVNKSTENIARNNILRIVRSLKDKSVKVFIHIFI